MRRGRSEAVREAIALLLTGALAVTAGCGGGGALRHDDEAVLSYGYGPRRTRQVTYQPDVVIIGGGPKAIRAVSDDSLTWTIDGSAKGVRELSVGKIMFASSRAVGRVVALQSRGNGVAVTLAPVSFTDIVRDADLKINTALKPDDVIFHESIPPARVAGQPPFGSAAVLRPAVLGATERAVTLVPVGLVRRMTGKVKVGNWEIEPYFKQKGSSGMTDEAISRGAVTGQDHVDGLSGTEAGEAPQKTADERSDEVGVKLQYVVSNGSFSTDGGDGVKEKTSSGLKFGGSVRFFGENIRVRSHISVAGGNVSGASGVVIDGIDRVAIGMLGGVENGAADNLKARVEIPAELLQQIPPEVTDGVPLAIHIKFKFIVETAFSGKNSALWTHGTYRLSGPIGYENGSVLTPALQTIEPMISALQGTTIGASGLVLATELRLLVGLGTEVMMGGPYLKLTIAGGVAKGSALAFGLGGMNGGPTCRSVTIKGDVGYGIGVLVDTKWFGDAVGKLAEKWKKSELELLESTATFYSRELFMPDIPLCRAGGQR
jgi:hypothetical protein